MDYEDPMDLSFPYRIEPGQLHGFILDQSKLRRVLGSVQRSKIFDRMRRSGIWIEIVTAGGNRRLIGGEEALPWRERPAWTKIGNEDD